MPPLEPTPGPPPIEPAEGQKLEQAEKAGSGPAGFCLGEAQKKLEPLTASSDSAISRLEGMVSQLQSQCLSQMSELKAMNQKVTHLERDADLNFSVLQYNILANYLGKNTQPWLLYGANVSEEMRSKIFEKFYEKGPDGKYANAGWPKYVVGLLTEEEIAAVDAYQSECFDWSKRRDRILNKIQCASADILSLVEMDEWEDFRTALAPEYEGVFRKRPRRGSLDGCAVLWRTGKFHLEASHSFDFLDSVKGDKEVKDRSCVFVLLRFAYSRHRVLVISTHLARNPEDPAMTRLRARQTAQLIKHLTEFSNSHDSGEVPVVLMGDLNAQDFGEIRGVARTLFKVSRHETHPFLWRSSDVPTGVTSSTETRNVRIDAVMFEPGHLKILEVDVPVIHSVIPNKDEPSDHVAVLVKFQVKPSFKRHRELAMAWLECLVGTKSVQPMTELELKHAFRFFSPCSGSIGSHELDEACQHLDCEMSYELQALLLTCFPSMQITQTSFTAAYNIALRNAKVTRLRGMGELERAFNFFDEDQDGKLTIEDIKSAFFELAPIDVKDEEVVAQVDALMTLLPTDAEDAVDIQLFTSTIATASTGSSPSQKIRGSISGGMMGVDFELASLGNSLERFQSIVQKEMGQANINEAPTNSRPTSKEVKGNQRQRRNAKGATFDYLDLHAGGHNGLGESSLVMNMRTRSSLLKAPI